MTKPKVTMRSIVEKEVVSFEQGQKISNRIPVGTGRIPDTLKLYFTLTIVNEGDGLASNVVIDNPIPPGTSYAIGSATRGEEIVLCSTDHGESYHSEDEQISQPGPCTDIRWVIGELPPRAGCVLSFQVIVGRLPMVDPKPHIFKLFSR
jgi:uncharacterized repeat protein (TIGR01451 family)